MSNDVVLHDVEGNQILPVTVAHNVFVSESETLKEVLERIASLGVTGAYVLPVASKTQLGGVKVGKGLGMTDDGTLYCNVGMSRGAVERYNEVHGRLGRFGSAVIL